MDKIAKLLVIEDEAPIRSFLRAGLATSGYQLVEALGGEEGIHQAATHSPDLILLDLGLPDIDGIEVTKRIREWSQVPIIILSARGQDEDKVTALDIGANDYLTKPFSMVELQARIRVWLRRARRGEDDESGEISAGPIKIDFAERRVLLHNAEIHLTPIEYKLLSLLMRNAGKVLTHKKILTEVWGPSYSRETHYLRVFMKQLRHKLEQDPARPEFLTTEPGVGYRFRIKE